MADACFVDARIMILCHAERGAASLRRRDESKHLALPLPQQPQDPSARWRSVGMTCSELLYDCVSGSLPLSVNCGYCMFAALLKSVAKIPFGCVATYGQVARAAGYPGAARQVVWALRSVKARGLAWHRVVGAGGRILLPGEAGLEQKMRLAAEGVTFKGLRVDLKRHQHNFRKRAARERA